MKNFSLDGQKNEIVLIARILLVILFVLFGWQKITGFEGTVGYMAHVGAPVPTLSAAIAVLAELGGGLLILVGFYTRPLALLMALYTIATALIGHRFWTMTGMEQFEAMINFYKNISIAGGFLLLAVTGPGRYSIDRG